MLSIFSIKKLLKFVRLTEVFVSLVSFYFGGLVVIQVHGFDVLLVRLFQAAVFAGGAGGGAAPAAAAAGVLQQQRQQCCCWGESHLQEQRGSTALRRAAGDAGGVVAGAS